MNLSALHAALHGEDGLSHSDRHALLVLALHADHRGRVAMPVRALAEMTGIKRSTAAAALDRLHRAQMLRVARKGAGEAPTLYELGEAARRASPCPAPDPAPSPKPASEPHVPAPHAGGSAESTASQPPPGHPDPWAWDAPALSPKPASEPHVPAPKPEPAPDSASASSPGVRPQEAAMSTNAAPAGDPVQSVIAAARVEPDPTQPLYWYRHEHRAELEAVLDRCGVDLATALARLRAAPPAGTIRRIRDLEPTIAQEAAP